MHLLLEPSFWLALFSVTLVQIALGADNLIIITIIAGRLPESQRIKAINLGLILAMLFRILLLAIVSWVLRYATAVFWSFDGTIFGKLHLVGGLSGKALLLAGGGLFLIWKGVKELRLKSKGAAQEMASPWRAARRLSKMMPARRRSGPRWVCSATASAENGPTLRPSICRCHGWPALFTGGGTPGCVGGLGARNCFLQAGQLIRLPAASGPTLSTRLQWGHLSDGMALAPVEAPTRRRGAEGCDHSSAGGA